MGVVVLVLVLVLDVLVTGVKQSQLLDLSLGLGLEFDNKTLVISVKLHEDLKLEFCTQKKFSDQNVF